MSAEYERGLLTKGHLHEGTEREETERLWESHDVRWSALSGLLLLAGFRVSVLDVPDSASTALDVAATVAGARFFAVEALEEVPGAWFGVLTLPMAVAGRELSELAGIVSGLRMARAGVT